MNFSRREFLRVSAGAGAAAWGFSPQFANSADASPILPEGSAPPALDSPHFASRMQAFVWRNWPLVPIERMAATVTASPDDIHQIALWLGLGRQPEITPEIRSRAYISVIRRNWHLLPYDQLLTLLDWPAERLAYTLREDDFLYYKLGQLKPKCEPLKWSLSTPAEVARAIQIAAIVREEFGSAPLHGNDPLFSFVSKLSAPIGSRRALEPKDDIPRFCYSYFAPYGDALLDPSLDPYPDGYLARLAESGVNGVWLQGVLTTLSPFPWEAKVSDRFEERRENLRQLTARAAKYGIRVYLYLNEPRARRQSFFENRPGLKGVTEGEFSALCTSAPEVQAYLTDAIESLCRAVPDLGGYFTITASEALTNCWSHNKGSACPRCSARKPYEVIAEVNALIAKGIEKSGNRQRLFCWDWGWKDEWSEEVIARLPDGVSLQSTSEWGLPIERGGVKSKVGEYTISIPGPGERAKKHWAVAKARGLSGIAKIQAALTWEMSAVPFVPTVAEAWQHGRNLRDQDIAGLMLGWTLGGHPSPNLDAAVTGLRGGDLHEVAHRRHGKEAAPIMVKAWQAFSDAMREFPFSSATVYSAPLQMGPANPLWLTPTGYAATMVGIAYDDIKRWRSIYPLEVFWTQLEKVADGFDHAVKGIREVFPVGKSATVDEETAFAEVCALHWRSVATQAHWTAARDATLPYISRDNVELAALASAEINAAKRLHAIQSADSRIGFEASNHYYYVPIDLVEKVVNCRWILERLA